MILIKFFAVFFDFVRRGYNRLVLLPMSKSRLGYCGKNVNFRNIRSCPTSVMKRVYLYDNTTLNSFNMISAGGRFIMKKNSGSSSNLTIITGNHNRKLRVPFMEGIYDKTQFGEEKDIIVEEDVWIGANVTLLSGITIGRGSTVGAGSVCVKNIPPYSVVMGNPAKVIGFNFSPEEVIEHETALYPEEERLPLSLLQKNYDKYFINRIREIKEWSKL